MKILLTNDDGIDAPGLAALEASIPAGVETVVVAPDRQRSECGHSVTTRSPLVMSPRGPNRWAVNGTPADCIRLALAVLDHPPGGAISGIISGVNDGGNLGADIYMSGTVAAAREAALRGLPAVAVSHYRHPDLPRRWSHVREWLDGWLLNLLTTEHREGAFWNVNLPATEKPGVPPRRIATLDQEPMPIFYEAVGQGLQYRVNYQGRTQNAGTDITACFTGNIALTSIPLGC